MSEQNASERFEEILCESHTQIEWFARSSEGIQRKYLGHVYIVRRRHTTQFKIGWSKKPEARLKSLQVASPEILEMHYFAPLVGRDAERDVQEMWGWHRTRGEWFDLTNWGGPKAPVTGNAA